MLSSTQHARVVVLAPGARDKDQEAHARSRSWAEYIIKLFYLQQRPRHARQPTSDIQHRIHHLDLQADSERKNISQPWIVNDRNRKPLFCADGYPAWHPDNTYPGYPNVF